MRAHWSPRLVRRRWKPPRLQQWLGRAFARQQGRGFLWWPIALTLGDLDLFRSANRSRRCWWQASARAWHWFCSWLGRSLPLLVLAALVAAGFALAKFRSDAVATPLLRATTAEVLVTGRIAAVERATRGRLTIILAPDTIEGLTAENTPRRLRSVVASEVRHPALWHARVSLKARLSPLPTPVQPGGFDYGRKLWFEGIGGTGRVTAAITLLDAAIPLARAVRGQHWPTSAPPWASASMPCWMNPMPPSPRP